MNVYSKTIYVEVRAEDEAEAETAVYRATRFVIEDENVTFVDYDGPIELAADCDGDDDEGYAYSYAVEEPGETI